MAKTKRTQQGLDLTRRLAVYSAAVGAGLVGANRADAAIHSSTGLNQSFNSGTGEVFLTMEGSSPELRFRGSKATGASLTVCSTSNGLASVFGAKTANNTWLLQVPSGAPIGPNPGSNIPNTGWGVMSSSGSGAWDADGETAYMGFSFRLADGSGSRVYGWAEIERVEAGSGILRGWGYEDSGAPILAGATSVVPEPSGLALLALGATGVAALRRRRSAV